MFENDLDEQRAIRLEIRKVAEREIPRFRSDQYYNQLPRELFLILAKAGAAGLSITEAFGGSAAGARTTSIVMEELAAVDLGPAIFCSVHGMASGLIQRFASDERKKALLPDLARGTLLAAFALTEPQAGSDAAALSSYAAAASGGWELSGSKCYISSAGFADIYVVFARTSKEGGAAGISAFIVPADAKGLTIGAAEHKMGGELSPIASLYFDKVFVPQTALLGAAGQGYAIALSGLAGGRVNIAACANGISRTALQLAARHLDERRQFGKKLSEFQALQFMLADMRMKLEAASLLTRQAADELERDGAQQRLYSSMAKCFASDAAMSITTDAVQLLGGAGYLHDYHVERLMREAKMLQIVEGTNQIQRLLIARELQGGAE